MTLGLAAVLAVVPGWAAASDAADVASPPADDPTTSTLQDVGHELRVTIDHGHARITIRREVLNRGDVDQTAQWAMFLPEDAVASGLRIRDRAGRRWLSARLLDATTAETRYREPGKAPSRSDASRAWLRWEHSREVQLQLHPVRPGTRETVEVTLIVPTVYADGLDRVTLPAVESADPIALVVEPAHRKDPVFIDGAAAGRRAVQRSLEDDIELSMRPRSAPPVDVRLAAVPLGDRTLVRQSVRLAPTLAAAPERAAVVVIIDGSRSLSEGQRATAVAAAQAYLRRFAKSGMRARAEVMVFDRQVDARHGRLVPAARALADLSSLPSRPPGNGSRVDAALQRANTLLAAADGSRPRRVLLLTDARTREQLKTERLVGLAEESGAIVHIGQLEEGPLHLERFDEHDWAEVAAPTGGVTWSLSVGDEPAAEVSAVLEELVRPRRVDAMTILPALPELSGATLMEGQSLESFRLVDGSVERMIVKGLMWNTPFERAVVPDDREGDRWAGLALGEDHLILDLEPEQVRQLALRGGVASAQTSFVVVEPGSPSPPQVTPRYGGGTGEGTVCGCGGGLGLIGASGKPRLVLDQRALLQDELDDALRSCGARSGQRARTVLQSTRQEIVEIDEVALLRTDDDELERCVTEALWQVELPEDFDDEWKRWTVEV